MASEQQIKQAEELSEAILAVEREKLLRPSLGEASLEGEFTAHLADIEKRIQTVLRYAPSLHNEQIGNILAPFDRIRTEMERQAGHGTQEYVAHREHFLNQTKAQLEEVKRFWPPIVTAAIEARGFLEDEGMRQEYERTIQSIKSEAESAIQKVREEADRTIEEARTLAEQIENRARLTAARISVDEAQKQFLSAQAALDKRVKIWAGLGSGCVASFLGAAVYFATLDLPDQWRWEVVYYSAIRVSILTAIGTVAAFCLKIFRAHLHMSEKNRHRQRVANSMSAFVESAVTPEQRDMILSQLVDSIVQFGNSGLVQREENSQSRPRTPIDSITRVLTTNPPKDQ